jgi:hypothetical protein
MKNPIAFLGGILAYLAGLTIVIFWKQSLGDPTFNPEIIESTIDKIMWAMACFGCAGGYSLVGVKLTLGKNTPFGRTMSIAFLICMAAFMAGLYYGVIFGSPW